MFTSKPYRTETSLRLIELIYGAPLLKYQYNRGKRASSLSPLIKINLSVFLHTTYLLIYSLMVAPRYTYISFSIALSFVNSRNDQVCHFQQIFIHECDQGRLYLNLRNLVIVTFSHFYMRTMKLEIFDYVYRGLVVMTQMANKNSISRNWTDFYLYSTLKVRSLMHLNSMVLIC